MSDFSPVSRTDPCPVCNGVSWCSTIGNTVVCMRVETGSVGESRNGGFIHRLGDQPAGVRRRGFVFFRGAHREDLADLATAYEHAATPSSVESLAATLGVRVESLYRLHVGWAFDQINRRGPRARIFDAGDLMRSCGMRAWSFPMTNPFGQVVGVRIRTDRGEKYAVPGSHDGLFIPDGLDLAGDTLAVCEGPTDTAALLGLGFGVVGRSCCTSGAAYLVKLLQLHHPARVVVMGDDDAPGRRGAESLATALSPYAPQVKVIYPPAGLKDARAWVKAGATADDVLHLIDATPSRKLVMRREAVYVG